MLIRREDYTATISGFRWEIPEQYNLGVDVCDRWAAADPTRPAIIAVHPDGNVSTADFATLEQLSNRLANAFVSFGLARGGDGVGERVAILLPQCVETAVSHIAVYKSGCVALPLFTLFGPDALLHRLRDSGARAIVTNALGARTIAAIKPALPALEWILSIDGDDEGALGYHQICAAQSDVFQPAETLADDPALLIYTSGTTGNPKGALHAHRVLLGHLPGVEISHNFLPQEGDRLWTPADWAWIGGLLDVLMPALHHGVPVVAHRFAKFDGAAALDLIKRLEIRNVFLPPTALRMMRQVRNAEEWRLKLRSVASGGEPLGGELLEWGRRVFSTTINEFYGQTECNMVVSSCSALEPPVPNTMGRPVPGHRVDIMDTQSGKLLPAGVEGAIVVREPDPVMFLRYWNDPEATERKFVQSDQGKWLVTGDRGVREADGKIRFIGRDDDVIASAGYRIGPTEVEDCLTSHPAVKLAGVVGKPDALRGSVVVAYITLADGYTPSDALAREIAEHVRSRVSAHEYPRAIRFIDEMPLTTTGKIIRSELRRLAKQEAVDEQAGLAGRSAPSYPRRDEASGGVGFSS